VVECQNATLGPDPHDAAGELMNRVGEAVQDASRRFNATMELHCKQAITLETAFESLRTIEENAAWATRMLVELTGQYRKKHGRTRGTFSMRHVAEVSGVSLASVHAWVNHPAKVLEDGSSGPGTLPRPGQTSHSFGGGARVFREDDTDGVNLDELRSD
jgi:hypothetical protein